MHPSRNFLLADDEDDFSDSSDSQEEVCHSNTETLPSVPSLPKPAFTEPSCEVTSPGPSIFANPFELAAKAKQAILEKHVKMTEKIVTNSNKPVCKKFKRGRCYFGDKCRFSHDVSNIVSMPPDDETTLLINKTTNRYNRTNVGLPLDTQDDDSYMANAKRKKRVGMTDTLVPPKRSLVALNKQRQQDRPWTYTGNKKSRH